MSLSGLPAIVRHFAHFLGAGNPMAERAAALASLATLSGHVCADLERDAGWGPWAAELDAAARATFRAQLPALDCVGGRADWTPLAWDGQRLYLRRYWDYEQRVAADLLARAGGVIDLGSELAAELEARFADAGQRQAAGIALGRRLALISGGPGTGKTHTLARIIGLLQSRNPTQRILLAAPTGKAAARMTEALRSAGVTVEAEARTLHRLLGVRADGSGFRHHRDNPLAADVLVVDEASMIDLSLMAHLLDALPAAAQLILLGDRNQLSAVEAGAVFADLCDSPQLAGAVATLSTSFRFSAESGVGRLAECLRTGDAAGTIDQLQAEGGDLVWLPPGGSSEPVAVARAGYASYREGVAAGLPAQELFERFNRFRVLCAHRQDAGAINRALSADNRLLPAPGTPLMVLRNDALLRVFNGDIALMLPDPADGALKACFMTADAQLRWIPLSRLPAWEPAWAMTIHKSQGSEFDTVLLVLPANLSQVATRELVYTGVTRAKRQVLLHTGENVLRTAISQRAERMSGLQAALGQRSA
jgi:exodeoxyribonuclease V alpha subunit